MDKFRAIATFVRIVEAGSLTAAAERLDTSLTSVVRSLAALEKAVGVRLLNRTTRRMALTDEGQEYFERCRRLLAEVDEAEAALSERRLKPTGKLTITAPAMFGRLHVGPVLTEFLGTYPEVRAELLLLDRVVDLVDEGIDIAIRIGNLPESSLVALSLGSTRRIFCASPAYLERQGRPEHPRDLSRHRCIRFFGLSHGLEWEFMQDGKPLRVAVADVLATNQVDAALDACAKGLGYGHFLAYQARDLLASGQLVRILAGFEPEPLAVSLAYPHSRLLSSRIRAFIDWTVPRLRERLADRP